MNKKKLILIIVLIVIVLSSSLGTFIYFHEKSKSYYFYLYTGNVNMIKWYYNDSKWYIMNDNKKLDDYFDLYLKGGYEGKYRLAFHDQWYYFDKNNNSTSFDDVTFMVDTNYDFKSYKFERQYAENTVLANSVAKKIGLNMENYDYILNQVKIDGLKEIKSIYLINFYTLENFDSLWPSYSVAFTYDNNKIKIINNVSSEGNNYEYCSLGVQGVFTFENDNPKVLLACGNFDRLPGEFFLYEYSWNNYDLLIKSNGGDQ